MITYTFSGLSKINYKLLEMFMLKYDLKNIEYKFAQFFSSAARG